MYYRQGDLYIRKINNIPEGLEESKDKVLIKGTGNHELSAGKAYLTSWSTDDMTDKEKEMLAGYFYLSKKSKVIHTEKGDDKHKELELPKGNYAFFRQREYLPSGYQTVKD